MKKTAICTLELFISNCPKLEKPALNQDLQSVTLKIFMVVLIHIFLNALLTEFSENSTYSFSFL